MERRAEPRLFDADVVVVRCYDGLMHREYPGRVRNVSSLGIAVEIDYLLPVGTAVKISDQRFGDCSVFGIIRHRLSLSDCHSLGIEFVDELVSLAVHLEVQPQRVDRAEVHQNSSASLASEEPL
jgi:hypothetical protein